MKYLAETFGTFCLVLIGAGSIAIALPHLWIAVAFSVIVTVMILCFGKISGAHINPAVSVGFYLLNKDKISLYYIPFQLVGGVLAAIVLMVFLPDNETYGETLPSVGIINTFLIEVIISFILMLSIFLIGQTHNVPKVAVVVGFVIFLAAYFAGPHTGASMNPARSLGPGLVSKQLSTLWIYVMAPIVGAALAVPFYLFFQKSRTK